MRRPLVLPLAFGVAGGLGTIAYALVDRPRAILAWAAAFGFGVATSVAALVLVFVLHLTGARWWLAVRRPFVACAGILPLYVVLFLPVAGSLRALYPWAQPPADMDGPARAALAHQRLWNEPAFFLGRSAFYLVVWAALAIGLERLRARWADEGDETAFAAARRLAAVPLPVLAFTLTFAAFDWLMSVQPGWISDLNGLTVFAGGLVSALAVGAIGAWALCRRGDLARGVAPDHFHAIGRLLLFSVVFWAYLAFFQLLLIWIADLPREVSFYRARVAGSWGVITAVLVVAHFVLPFLALLSRRLKRTPALLAGVAAWLVLASALDFVWLVLPSAGARLSALDALPFVCVLGFGWAAGTALVMRRTRPDHGSASLREALRYRSP